MNWPYNAATTTQTLPRSPSRASTPNFTRTHNSSKILIANPRLEFLASTTKQTTSHFLIANRLQFSISAPVTPAVSSRNSLNRTLRSASPSLRTTSLPAEAHSTSGRFVDTIHKSPVTSHDFLIETPRLELPATHRKQTSDPISNRDNLAFSQAGILPWRTRPLSFSPFTNHKSPVTSHAFLIYRAAIRNAAN